MGIRHYMDPRSLFCLTGIAVRLAYRMGLHRDGAEFQLSPFEVEERRRLWWTLVSFDRRIGEMTGSTITAISNGGDCKLPLNINDADLHLHAKGPPNVHVGATEMIFALTRLEFAKAPGSDKMKSVISEASPQVANMADHRMISYIERLVTHLEDTYFKHCDPKIPLHYFTLMMTRQSICKLRVISGFYKIAMTAPQPLSAAENEQLFIESIKMIEYDSMIQSNDSLKGFRWFTLMHFPFPAYVALAKELRTRTSGELCDRAWQAMVENHEARGITRKMHSPMHLAFTPIFLKAWNAREAHESSQGRTLAPPAMVTGMRQLAARLGLKENSKSPEANTPILSPRSFSSPDAEMNPPPVSSMPAYPVTTAAWNNTPAMNMNPAQGQYAGAFADVNFGGEVDWNFLFHQYSGLQPVQPALHHQPPPPPPQMPVATNDGIFSVWQ